MSHAYSNARAISAAKLALFAASAMFVRKTASTGKLDDSPEDKRCHLLPHDAARVRLADRRFDEAAHLFGRNLVRLRDGIADHRAAAEAHLSFHQKPAISSALSIRN